VNALDLRESAKLRSAWVGVAALTTNAGRMDMRRLPQATTSWPRLLPHRDWLLARPIAAMASNRLKF
jgi:hypothetical protein